MTAKAALVLGIALVLAALLHGGIYATGHDFVVNRFTGTYEFVPAYDEEGGEEMHVRRTPANLDLAQGRR